MKNRLILLALLLWGTTTATAQTRTIHVFVALADNKYQGIVPVGGQLGNGQDAANNLYWGAMYGVKAWFKRDADWELLQTWTKPESMVLEALLFKHTSSDTYLYAQAYDGQYIKTTTENFLKAAAGKSATPIAWKGQNLQFGGKANLVAYIGHDGLMDFSLSNTPQGAKNERDVIILACISKTYFSEAIRKSGANPLVWTTGLMAPEAYTLDAAIDGWIKNEEAAAVRERAAAAYHKYQKCGMNGARNLLVTGW